VSGDLSESAIEIQSTTDMLDVNVTVQDVTD
jgi:hypothetical protein